MGLFTRLTTTLYATADNAVSRVENHDAIIEAAIRDVRAAAAKARVRQTRLARDGKVLRQRLADVVTDEATWTERAKATGTTDKSKAIECLRRRQQCREQIEQLQGSLRQHEELESQVSASMKKIDERMRTISHQRNQMRSRESAAKAMSVISRIDEPASHSIDDTFDRWEMSISETEITTDLDQPVDSFDSEFVAEEDLLRYSEELNALLADEQDKQVKNND